MKISVLTLFKDSFGYFKQSIIGRAISNGSISIDIIDIRLYSKDKHNKCDDTPYGGGAGMVMTAQPILDCIDSIDPMRQAYRVYLTPVGYVWNDKLARQYAQSKQDLILLCGHYEGIDQRVVDIAIDECISIGDYVLTGGELAAMVVIDSLARYCKGVLGSENSTHEESFGNGLLEYPQYTKPEVLRDCVVPKVLTSGNHGLIDKWRKEQSISNTKKYRPDLIKN